MHYRLRPLDCRPWTLNGLTPRLIESHYENDYGRALRRLNDIAERLAALNLASAPAHEIVGLKREELAALNSVSMHELYFSSLGGDAQPTASMQEALAADFGSLDAWRDAFRSLGYALGGRSGWVTLAWLPRDGRLANQLAETDVEAVAGGIPILALDMYEHAYHTEFGANARAYVDTFMRNINWASLEVRLNRARRAQALPVREQAEFADVPSIELDEVREMIASGGRVQLLDVRPRHFVSRQQEIVVGAEWRDPDQVQQWKDSLTKDNPVVVYCAYGFHVGCKTTIALREAGYDARFMSSGHSGWRAAGAAVKRFEY